MLLLHQRIGVGLVALVIGLAVLVFEDPITAATRSSLSVAVGTFLVGLGFCYTLLKRSGKRAMASQYNISICIYRTDDAVDENPVEVIFDEGDVPSVLLPSRADGFMVVNHRDDSSMYDFMGESGFRRWCQRVEPDAPPKLLDIIAELQMLLAERDADVSNVSSLK